MPAVRGRGYARVCGVCAGMRGYARVCAGMRENLPRARHAGVGGVLSGTRCGGHAFRQGKE